MTNIDQEILDRTNAMLADCEEKRLDMVLGLMRQIKDPIKLQQIQDLARSQGDRPSRQNLNVGDMVQMLEKFWGRKPYNVVGTIVKINRVKCKIRFNGVHWNVPPSMFSVASDEAIEDYMISKADQ